MVKYKSGIYYYICDGVVYAIENTLNNVSRRVACEGMCSSVWYQGPRGGVKRIDFKHNDESVCQYVTKDNKLMKEFMWVKLQAQPFN